MILQTKITILHNLNLTVTGLILILGFVFFFFIFKYYKSGKFYEKMFIKQGKIISQERTRISSEIHDEIGSGLTAIKLYTEHASKTRPDVREIQHIKVMIDEISQKINEIVWSTNTENDELDNLVYFIEDQTRQLFKHTEIRFHSEIDQNIPDLHISNQSKRECYLLIKEIAHNALKHAKATSIKLLFNFDNEHMIISFRDDGTGFDIGNSKGKGMGLENIRLRAERLKGTMIMEQYKGTMISVKIPLKPNLAPKM
ncbi:sensor histidine kinase [Pedobacter sp. BMA]|uniref:sensor histidine kinase n=1 Tax=Pedobacter sp. BMA TaxID=1663685 RepID=UPI00064977CF|nr:ATP-binding protein [Pedobacter sp. BMA]KLT67013.1 hypothetical protein AB669_03590 [Pedobacter sp. BMA]